MFLSTQKKIPLWLLAVASVCIYIILMRMARLPTDVRVAEKLFVRTFKKYTARSNKPFFVFQNTTLDTCVGWNITETVRHWNNAHWLMFSVVVHQADGRVCVGCSVDAVLRTPILNEKMTIEVVSDYTPELTGLDGRVTLHFKVGTFNVSSLELLAGVSSIRGMDAAVVDPLTCLWSGTNGDVNISHKRFLAGMCTQYVLKQVAKSALVLTSPRATTKKPKETPCQQYLGLGIWDVREGRYEWKENGCSTLTYPYKKCTANGTKMHSRVRIAFVGDSVLRNLFYEWSSWAMGTTGGFGNMKYTWHDSIVEARYFETYGYYPIKHFSSPNDPSCCGETDCVRRQKAREHREGFTKLQDALRWLEEVEGKGGWGTALLVRSPVIHQARAYVSDVTHSEVVTKMINMLKPGLSVNARTTIWVSATSRRDHHIKGLYIENRQARRYRLHCIEMDLLSRVSAILGLRQLNLWDMTRGRRDRYFDETHVWPTYRMAVPFLHTISKTWTDMLNTMLIQRELLCTNPHSLL